MKALIIGLNYDPEPTGIAPYTSALCRGLLARGHQVRVITAMPHYPYWRVANNYAGWRRRDVIDGVPVTRLRHFVPRRPTLVLRLISECSFGIRVALSRWGGPDVVVFVSPALIASGLAIILRVPTQPFVVWVQDVYSLGIAETRRSVTNFVATAMRTLEGFLLRRATGVVVIHRRFVEVMQRLGVRSDRVRVVRNWTHLPDRVPHDRALVRRQLGWAEDLTVVLHSGAIGVKQDLDNVVSAARLAEADGAPVQFVLSGMGSERARLERLASGTGTIKFTDPLPQEDFQDQLAAADVLLVNEHIGLRDMAVPSKLTSYFSSGRPIVAATSSGSVTAEEVETSGAGIRVDPGDPGSLVQAVLQLRADGLTADRLGQSGRRYRDQTLSEAATLGSYIRWLEQIASSNTRRSLFLRLRRRVRASTLQE